MSFNLDNLMSQMFGGNYKNEGDSAVITLDPTGDLLRQNDSLELAQKSKKMIVVDFDEVIVNISYKWWNKLKASGLVDNIDKEKFDLMEKCPNARNIFHVDKYLSIDEKSCNDLYFEDPTFYDDIPVASTYNMLKLMHESSMIGEILVLTKVGDSLELPVNKSKQRLMLKLFNDVEFKGVTIKFAFITSGNTKADYIVKNAIFPSIIFEDGDKNLKEFFDAPICDCTYMIPVTGYNYKLGYDHDIIEELGSKRCAISYYENNGRDDDLFENMLEQAKEESFYEIEKRDPELWQSMMEEYNEYLKSEEAK